MFAPCAKLVVRVSDRVGAVDSTYREVWLARGVAPPPLDAWAELSKHLSVQNRR